MNNDIHTHKHGYLKSTLCLKCPRCRTGDMFKSKSSYHLRHFMKMYEKCPLCGQRMEIEIGFYYGTSYVSYALSIAISVATFIAWWLLFGISANDNRVFWWMSTNIVLLILLQPYLMRLSRTLWLSVFASYNPNWRLENAEEPERIVAEEMNNW